jgi:hypothetical protein
MIPMSAQRLLERLTTPLDLDAYLSTINPLWGQRTRGRIVSIQPVGSTLLRAHPPRRLAAPPTRSVQTLGVDIDGVHHRSFTLTRCPTAHPWTIQARPTAPSRHLVHDAAVGDVVPLLPAAGEWTSSTSHPLAAAVHRRRQRHHADRRHPATSTAGVDTARWCCTWRVAQHALFTDELDRLADCRRAAAGRARALPAWLAPPRADHLAQLCPDWAARRTCVGPGDARHRRGSARRGNAQLHLERFHPARPTARCRSSADGEAGRRRLFASDVVAPAPDRTPLPGGQAAGLTRRSVAAWASAAPAPPGSTAAARPATAVSTATASTYSCACLPPTATSCSTP